MNNSLGDKMLIYGELDTLLGKRRKSLVRRVSFFLVITISKRYNGGLCRYKQEMVTAIVSNRELERG